MSESQTKIDAAAQKAYAAAADKTAEVDTAAVAKAVEADSPASVQVENVAEAVAAAPKQAGAKPKKAATKTKPVAAKRSLKKVAARTAVPAKVKPAATSNTPITKLKETIMATAPNANTTDYTTKAKEMAAEMQNRAKAAYDKGAEMTQDAVDFQKGNLEALVESGKILAGGMQDMGRAYVEDARSAAETVQGDVKKMAGVKSPTELFQLQGEIARRNFDAMVKVTSKNTEAMLKLANEAFAPLSSRMSLAAEKVRKAA